MERGWKAAAGRLAIEVRAEIGASAHERVDLLAIAELYGLPVYLLSDLADFGCSTEVLARLAGAAGAQFSAALIPDGRRRCVVVNDYHAPTRQRSSLAHEVAHLLLEHEFTASIMGPEKCRLVDPVIEDQASWFAGELLIPTEAARRLAAYRLTDEDVAKLHGLSPSLAAMRMNTSGARKIAQRADRKRAQTKRV
jgi:hypothetical protein